MEKKQFNQKYKEVFTLISAGSILDPLTAMNISYFYHKGNEAKISKNLWYPRLAKKQGISGVQSLPDSKQVKTCPSIFVSFYHFCQDLKNCLHPKVYSELAKYRNNPQIQLQILKKIGL